MESCFFEKGNTESLYFKEKIFERIEKLYGNKLKELPPGAERRENGTRYISSPRFVAKKNQRITWKTRIDVVSKAYTYKKINEQPSQLFLALAGGLGQPEKIDSPNTLSSLLGFGLEKEELVANGRTTFEITWSILVTTKHSLRNPKIESIDFIEINWEDKIE